MGKIRVSQNFKKELLSFRSKIKEVLELDRPPSIPQTTELMLPRIEPIKIEVVKRRGRRKIHLI